MSTVHTYTWFRPTLLVSVPVCTTVDFIHVTASDQMPASDLCIFNTKVGAKGF
jgi:hypothetical protein